MKQIKWVLSAILLATNINADDKINSNSTFSVGLWGDQFYSENAQTRTLHAQQTVDSLNSHDLAFTLFTGDTKNGHLPCTDKAIGEDVLTVFNALEMPTIYSPGDNEWTDCHRTSNGGYDPLERLAYLRKTFFSQELSQGIKPLRVKRQVFDDGSLSENSRYVKNSVAFVALSIPGSNNNFVATQKQCKKDSNRSIEDCERARAEHRARNVRNITWLKASFEEARLKRYSGVVILIQADIFFPHELSDGGFKNDFLPGLDDNNGYTDFYLTLQNETQHFDGQVLLVHGDSHYFKIDKPMYDDDGRLTANFTRIQVFGDKDNSWVKVFVDPNEDNVFTFKPIILR